MQKKGIFIAFKDKQRKESKNLRYVEIVVSAIYELRIVLKSLSARSKVYFKLFFKCIFDNLNMLKCRIE